jgi:hypothetical protein
LLDLAVEQNVLEAVQSDIVDLCQKMVEQQRSLPVIEESHRQCHQKGTVSLKSLFEAPGINKLTNAFFHIIVLTKGREMYLPEITTENL